MKLKKPIKITLGVIIFLTLPSLLFCGYLYFKHHQNVSAGIVGKDADNLATKMLIALNYEAYTSTDYVEWTFKNRRHYKWEKAKHTCEVFWKDYKIRLDLKNHSESKAFVHGFTIEGEMGIELVEKGLDYFQKDIFWLNAPFKIFDEGVTRELVRTENLNNGLLVTNPNNETYLWHLDDEGKPIKVSMWDTRVPIDGLTAEYGNWQIAETGVKLPTLHKVLFTTLEISDLKAH